jgi:hypothetical protein
MNDISGWQKNQVNGPQSEPRYPYHNAAGLVVYEGVRVACTQVFLGTETPYEKTVYRRPGEADEFDPTTSEVRFYRLPELLKALDAGQPIVIAKDEPTADLCRSIGLAATCHAKGMGGWPSEHEHIFKGANINLLDNNFWWVAERLAPIAGRVRIHSDAGVVILAPAKEGAAPQSLPASSPPEPGVNGIFSPLGLDAVTEFIIRVLPWPKEGEPGFVQLWWRTPDPDDPKEFSWPKKSVRSVEKFFELRQWGLAKFPDSYFCTALQGEKSTRGNKTTLMINSLRADIDIKEGGYASLEEAIVAVYDFCKQTGIPLPNAWVCSGNGLHIYWIGNLALTPEQWLPCAEGLKAAAIEYGLKCDHDCTADLSRILRIPGTFNSKSNPPKLVYLFWLLPKNFDFVTELTILLEKTPVKTKRAPPKIETSEKFRQAFEADGEPAVPMEQVWGPPPTLEAVQRGCPWVDEMVRTGGKGYSQTLWFLSLGLATFIADGEETARKFSSGYEGYTEDETNGKYAEVKRSHGDNKGIGPPRCATIAAAAKTGECSKVCETCSKRELDKTPLYWARVDFAPEPPGQIETGFAGSGAAAKPPSFQEQMNQQFSAGFIGSKFRIAKFDPHSKYPLQTHVEFLTKDDFINGIRNPPVEVPKFDTNGKLVGTTRKPRGAYWLEQLYRAEHNAVTFQPGALPIIKVQRDGRIHRVINTFSGFAVRPDHKNSEAKCAKYLAHIRENVAGGDEAASEYYIDWMASGVQYPGDPGRSSPSIRGPQGGGKGVAVLTYGRLFGQHFLHATQREHVVGKFNKHQAEVCLIFVDEALYAQIAADTQTLKTLTSETTKLLERKGIDAVQIDNYARLIFATNAEHPIQIEWGDRRYPAYLVIDHESFRYEKDPIKKANKRRAYFLPILHERESGGYEALLGFLLDRDIRNFNPEAIPETPERQMQQLLSASAGDKMIIEFAQDGCLPGAVPGKPGLARAYKSSGLYCAEPGLLDTMKTRGGSKLVNESSNMLTGILKAWGFTKKHTETGNAWEAPALLILRAKIKEKYPAVEFDIRTEWAAEDRYYTPIGPTGTVSTGMAPKTPATSDIDMKFDEPIKRTRTMPVGPTGPRSEFAGVTGLTGPTGGAVH